MRLLLWVTLLLTFESNAQIGTGEWRLHVPTLNSSDVEIIGNQVYASYANGVMQYDQDAEEISMWNIVNGLSDISITCLGKSTSNQSLFIGYSNGNIDKIKNDKVTNIPAIVLASIQGNKQINDIVEYNNYVYFATGFAIVKIDPVKNEVRDTYYPTNGIKGIVDLAFRNDSIFALTENELYVGVLSNPALADPTQWVVDSRVPESLTDVYQDIETVNNELYLTKKVNGYGLDTLFRLDQSQLTVPFTPTFTMEIESIDQVHSNLALNIDGAVVIFDSGFNQDIVMSNFNGVGSKPSHIAYKDNTYWVADKSSGLIKTEDGYNNYSIKVEGPPKNSFYKMNWVDDVLSVAGGGLDNTVLTYSKAGFYTFEDEEWTLYDNTNMPELIGLNYWDHLDVAINPLNENQIVTSTYSTIPLIIVDRTTKHADTLTPNNSILEYRNGMTDWSLVNGLQYDDEGNLWLLNGYSNAPLKMYSKDGEWYEANLGSATIGKFTRDMVMDYNGNLWIAMGGGVYGYDVNETPTVLTDDKMIHLNAGESTGALPSANVNAIAVDFDNEIWIGTEAGFAVLYNSDNSFDAGPGDYNAQRIKIEFEGNVEYVLGASNITAIEVDGANRKWMATQGAGIVLLSADGLEILEQYTTENSPLLSNDILDLELNQNTGELFIATSMGLVSYRTDATYGKTDYEDVTVFPNPARPEFDGPITIQGIKYDSDVKVTDAAGNLVYMTTSNGGTATWNGKTVNGDPVKTGVYLFWTAPNDGKGRMVGKVLIVN